MESKYKKESHSLAVIIPMFNEEIGATRCIQAVASELGKLKIRNVLIVIDDGSQDNTHSLLQTAQKKYGKKLIVVTHKKNKGFGGATKSGIKKALELNYEYCLHMDSDLTNNPRLIHTFVKYQGKFDCVKASRYTKGGKVKGVSKFRRAVSISGNFAASIMFGVGIRDCTNGFRMVRTSCLKNVKLKENNFSIILEELYYLKKMHCSFKEIPYTLTARTESVSRFNYKPAIFRDYFKYVLKSFLTTS